MFGSFNRSDEKSKTMFAALPLKHPWCLRNHSPASEPVHLALADGRYGILNVLVTDAISPPGKTGSALGAVVVALYRLSVIGTENLAPDAVTQSSENQAPDWQPQLLIVTVTVLSLRWLCAKVISSPNSLTEYASNPMLGRLPGSGCTLLR